MASISRRHRRRAAFRRRTPPGAPPGTLVPDAAAPPVCEMHVLAYGPEGFEERRLTDPRQVRELRGKWPVTWVNVDGVGDAALVQQLGELFHLHRLALEDVLHVHQRAKAEAYAGYYFVVARMPCPTADWLTEQVSLFFGENFVLTFQERPGGDCLDPVRLRIRSGLGRTRTARPDYLVYALLDSIVDHYFPLVEECGERLDALESDVMAGSSRGAMPRIHAIRGDLLAIRRAIWPLRDAINTLLRDTSPLVSDETRVYLRDVHDHTIQILDLVDNYRDTVTGITEVHLASVSQRTNEIMKVLTIIATIFIPLTFIVGVYGMNFDPDRSPWNMPELRWYWGYVLVWLVMIAATAAMLVYFYRKGWMGRDDRNP